jgi:hypothetical protein
VEFPDTYEAKSPPEWATYCPGRKPEFKVHTKLATAHLAIGVHKPHTEIALYHIEIWDGNPVWIKTWEYTYPTNCAECNGPMPTPVRSKWNNMMTGFNVAWDWKGTVKDAPVVCNRCRQRSYERDRQERIRKAELAQLAALKKRYE